MESDCNSQDKPELWAKGCLWENSVSSAENIAEWGRTYPRSWHREGHRHLHQPDMAGCLALSSTSASVEEGVIVAAVQVRRTSCSAFVSMWCMLKESKTVIWPWVVYSTVFHCAGEVLGQILFCPYSVLCRVDELWIGQSTWPWPPLCTRGDLSGYPWQLL